MSPVWEELPLPPLLLLLLALCLQAPPSVASERTEDDLCAFNYPECHPRDYDYSRKCIALLRDHVASEVLASMTYLAMASHFGRFHVNRPGASEFFYKSASEERQHALKMMDYLVERGDDNVTYVSSITVQKFSWKSVEEALSDALDLEKWVTQAIQNIISECSAIPDHHLSDYLIHVFLEEQMKSVNLLSLMVNKLHLMSVRENQLAEFLFDQELMSFSSTI